MKVTIVITFAFIAVFAATSLLPSEEIFETYGFSGENVVQRPYVFVTSLFLHGSLEHLLSNILAFLIFGIVLESEAGWKRMLVVFFAGALAGDVVALAVYGGETVAIGASAGIFSLIGFGMIIKPMDTGPSVFPLHLVFLGVMYIAYNLVGMFSGPGNIAYTAHFAGLAVGIAAGLVAKQYSGHMKL